MADGLTNQTSAERLMLSARTSQGHSNNLYHKLKDTIWTRSMSAFLKSNLHHPPTKRLEQFAFSHTSTHTRERSTKKPPKDFSRSGFFSTIRLKDAT